MERCERREVYESVEWKRVNDGCILELHKRPLLAPDDDGVFKALKRHCSVQLLTAKVKNNRRRENGDDENNDGEHHGVGRRELLALG